MSSISKDLRLLVAQSGMSITKLSNKSKIDGKEGISRTFLAEFIKGEKRLTLEKAEILAAVLGKAISLTSPKKEK
jgi:plasmid maintenance system antidote protein VapI